MNLVRIASVAAGEAERQQVGVSGLVRLLEAYGHASMAKGRPTLSDIRFLGSCIEPDNTDWRKCPVVFASGGSSAPWHEVSELMERLVAQTNDIELQDVDMWINTLLWIHPFKDGNDRLAWILRTWLLNAWEAPEPLPNYFGE